MRYFTSTLFFYFSPLQEKEIKRKCEALHEVNEENCVKKAKMADNSIKTSKICIAAKLPI